MGNLANEQAYYAKIAGLPNVCFQTERMEYDTSSCKQNKAIILAQSAFTRQPYKNNIGTVKKIIN